MGQTTKELIVDFIKKGGKDKHHCLQQDAKLGKLISSTTHKNH